MTVKEQDSIGAPRMQAPDVEVYDFRRPRTLPREHSRALELVFETFARQWGTQLTARVRVLSSVTCEQVLMQTYDEYAASLPSTTAMVLFSLEGLTPRAVIQFPTAAALAWVGHMLGGTAGGRPVEERKFTQIEQALLRQLMTEALEDLKYSLGSLITAAMTVDTIQYNSQFAQAAATGDLMIVSKFNIRVGEITSLATVAIPAVAIMPQLGEANPTSNTADAQELVLAQVSAVPVTVALRLVPAQVLPQRILTLTLGDLIPIPHPQHRPLDIVVDDHVLARAAMGANGSRLACIIIESEEKRP
ncbi:flagellar motor switch protein FliM [Cryobacterium sp. TMS1-20-1]|uniref:flagellar motor switch protein FliM n=1 Tax=Cryobacterium sp. TMS1-20-1 TaxID=1259223 RepID=UPI001F54807E|nr:flagellar motor switch protein FliM [Cryobacterium sp. TMS1-20-1]